MKILLLLTKAYPFGEGEEFIPAELCEAAGFDRILVCPCSEGLPSGGPVQKMPGTAELIRLNEVREGRGAYLRLALWPCVLEEIFRLLRAGGEWIGRVHELLYFMKNADRVFRGLCRTVPAAAGDEIILYSYWFYDAAAGGALFARRLRRRGISVRLISRAHGFDIHAERAKYGYLPMRSFLLRNMDRVYPCSEDGARTIRLEFPRYAGKVRVSHLGTRDCGPGKPGQNPFHIVSCSYLVPVKRIHLIAEALCQADFPAVWTHLGSGPEENRVRALAKGLPPGVRAEFPGRMPHAEILRYYRETPVSVFVNVSSSEGIPVSVMEACSFGIPVVATEVGGTGEIVAEGKNGFLLPKDFAPRELMNVLNRIRKMGPEEYGSLSKGARAVWEEKFNAAANYRRFYEEIGKL